jgi:hypothetical protein
VFRLKLKALIHEITTKRIFGTAVAHVYVIEYQMRGLPHAHILLFLSPGDKPTSPAKCDEMVSAEIPDATLDP